MEILLSNDDGVDALGLAVLYEGLKKLGRVTVVAPTDEKSTTGHSLTIHKPLRIRKRANGFYGITGSPADCVYLGVREILSRKPDWVVSGINRGANLGQDVYYSGTVSAAREAAIMGIPAMAVSLSVDFKKMKHESDLHFESAARATRTLITQLGEFELPKGTLLNVNVPDLPWARIKGPKICRQGFRHYSGTVLRRRDHRGRDYFWVGGQYKGYKNDPDTDCAVVASQYVAVTPLRLDTTHLGLVEGLSRYSERVIRWK
jgi:5'-nucleotidase